MRWCQRVWVRVGHLVEQAMFFLMGFLIAGLIALLFLPVLARRATRLSQARARLMAPLSQQQALAERDQLRAENAVERLRLEQRMAALADSAALHRADLGRRAATIVRLEDVAGQRLNEIVEQRSELAGQREEAAFLAADLATAKIALHDFAAQIERARADIAGLREARLGLETNADKNRTIFAGLETRAARLEIELEDVRRDAQAAARAAQSEQSRLAQALAANREDSRKLGANLNEAMAKGALLVAEADSRSNRLQEARARLAETEALLGASERARAEALTECRRLHKLIDERDQLIGDVEERAAEQHARLSRQLKAARADENAATSATERLKTGKSTTEGAMRALRGERALMRREIETLRAKLAAADDAPKGDAALREAISQLAVDVSRLSASDAAQAPSNLLNFELREPTAPPEFKDDAPLGANVLHLRQAQPRAPER